MPFYVYENMAFGLRNRHMPEDQIKEKVMEAAKILDIEDYLSRKPKEIDISFNCYCINVIW